MSKHKNPKLIALGEEIRKLREGTNLSQEEFAAKVGMDRSYYGGIERGERNVSSLNLIRIAKALNCQVGDLFPSIDDLSKL